MAPRWTFRQGHRDHPADHVVLLADDRPQQALADPQERRGDPEIRVALLPVHPGGELDQAIALAEKNQGSHVARVLGGALQEVKPLLRDRATITAADINSAERAVERQMLIVLSEFKRGLGILATVGSTSP